MRFSCTCCCEDNSSCVVSERRPTTSELLTRSPAPSSFSGEYIDKSPPNNASNHTQHGHHSYASLLWSSIQTAPLLCWQQLCQWSPNFDNFLQKYSPGNVYHQKLGWNSLASVYSKMQWTDRHVYNCKSLALWLTALLLVEMTRGHTMKVTVWTIN